MSWFAALKSRLHARSDSEHEQALLRILIIGVILAYMALFHGSPLRWSDNERNVVLTIAGFVAIAVAIFVAICIWPAASVPRRLLGMIADNAEATWYMAVAGD